MFSRIELGLVLLLSVICSIVAVNEKSWFGPEFTILRRVYTECQVKDDFTGCLKQKALAVVSRAINQDVIRVVDGVSFDKQNSSSKESMLDSADLRAISDLSALDRALLQKIDKFLQTHVLTVDMNEGRGKDKDKKMQKYIVAALLTAMGIAGPIGLKALAAVAGKALVISKVALTIAGIIALKKIFASEHHEETNFQVHAGDHNRRNTFVVRPVKPSPQPVDPYRYYYEYPAH